jgi:squalene synthase HpnC
VTRGATPVSHGRGPLNAPGANRWEGTAVSPAPGIPAGPEADDRTARITAAAGIQAPAENFPVALRMLPARYRQHLMAVYRFARTVDDIGDEAPYQPAQGSDATPGTLAEQRIGLLDEIDADLGRLYAGQPPATEVIGQLAATVGQCGIPAQPLRDLIQANRQDQLVSRYQTFGELAGYCRLSANPVGRIVLYVFGVYTAERAELSDRVCTALQLAEHWQDVAEDLRAGRIYLPAEDLAEYRCTEADLAQPSAGPAVRALMAYEVIRASALLSSGAPLIGTLRGAARVAVAGYVAGGRAALAAISAADHDVLSATHHPAKPRLLAELARAYVRGR